MEKDNQTTVDVCIGCLRDSESCECGVSVGKLMTLKEWRSRVDRHLGGVEK